MGKTLSMGFISATIDKIPVNSNIKCNTSNYTNCSSRLITYVVMHYTGNPKDTALANAKYFQGANRGVSAHFFVDDNSIYQSVEIRDRAWHCGAKTYRHSTCRNDNSIGIEMCTTAGNYRVSDKTKEHAAQLCAYLCKMVGITAGQVDTYVLRHYDVTGKSCPAQMASANNAEWNAFKARVKKILGGSSSSGTGSGNSTSTPVVTSNTSTYKVKVTADVLNVRQNPNASSKKVTSIKKGEVYTIVQTSGDWGKLKSGKGWINLSYTKRV